DDGLPAFRHHDLLTLFRSREVVREPILQLSDTDGTHVALVATKAPSVIPRAFTSDRPPPAQPRQEDVVGRPFLRIAQLRALGTDRIEVVARPRQLGPLLVGRRARVEAQAALARVDVEVG